MKVCMVVPNQMVKGGIASVVNGYRNGDFGERCQIIYVESYCDGSKWDKLFKALKGYVSFMGVLLFQKPDLVHIHSSFGPSFYRKMPFIYMASMKRIPVINHIHGAEFAAFYTNASAKKKKKIQKVYNRCDRLIALSEEWKEKLKRIVPEDKITVLQNYCTIPEPLNDAFLSDKKKNQVLFLGEIGKRKGCFDIPEVLEKTDFKENGGAFVFAGDGKPEDVIEIKESLADRGLSECVSFTGWVRGEAKEKLLKESGIFFFPSYHEGMPMAVLEAMAYGMAILTTDVGGIPRLITDGVDGYLCRPGDTKQMADRLKELLTDTAKAEKFGRAAREKAKNRYSRESHIKRLLQIYEEVVSKKE